MGKSMRRGGNPKFFYLTDEMTEKKPDCYGETLFSSSLQADDLLDRTSLMSIMSGNKNGKSNSGGGSGAGGAGGTGGGNDTLGNKVKTW